jgi:PhnB protein
MTDVNAYLFFNGNCAEAMKFYETTLGGKLRIVNASDMPGGSGDGVMHARLDVDANGILMASDWMAPGIPYPGMHGFRVCLTYGDDVDEARRICEALGAGGSVQMPFAKTFWAAGFGMVTDKFGVPWMVGTAT